MARAKSSKTARAAKRTTRARRIVQHAAKLAAGELARAKGERDIDPEDDGEEKDEPSLANAPAPPAFPSSLGMGTAHAGEQASPVPSWVEKLGDVPEDPAAAQYWLYRANVLSAHGALTDPNISEATRRKELRTISAAAARLMPDAERWRLVQIIKKDREELESKAKDRRAAKLVTIDPPAAPNLDPSDFGGSDDPTQ